MELETQTTQTFMVRINPSRNKPLNWYPLQASVLKQLRQACTLDKISPTEPYCQLKYPPKIGEIFVVLPSLVQCFWNGKPYFKMNAVNKSGKPGTEATPFGQEDFPTGAQQQLSQQGAMSRPTSV